MLKRRHLFLAMLTMSVMVVTAAVASANPGPVARDSQQGHDPYARYGVRRVADRMRTVTPRVRWVQSRVVYVDHSPARLNRVIDHDAFPQKSQARVISNPSQHTPTDEYEHAEKYSGYRAVPHYRGDRYTVSHRPYVRGHGYRPGVSRERYGYGGYYAYPLGYYNSAGLYGRYGYGSRYGYGYGHGYRYGHGYHHGYGGHYGGYYGRHHGGYHHGLSISLHFRF